jgi:hypothetical protein
VRRLSAFYLLVILTISASPLFAQQAVQAEGMDSLSYTANNADRDWWTLLKKNKLDLKDTTVEYPGFLGFCVKVYNWGDKVFNETDSTYIRGTGKRWKAILKSDNWVDSYAMDFNSKMPIRMLSDLYCNVGFYLSYMAVSVGYSLDFSNIIGNKEPLHKKFEFNFNCARFNADLYYNENTGGTYLRRFGNYDQGRWFKKQFPGLSFRSAGIDLYYIFNNYKYSMGAAYNFSRIQVRSAGSFIGGITISTHDVKVDFNKLPSSILEYYTGDIYNYRFRYNDFCFLLGYGYNWVFAKNFLFNITALPSIGYKHCLQSCTGGKDDIFSLNVKGKMGITYNYGDIFSSLSGKIDGHWFAKPHYNFFNSVENVALTLGVRF